MFTPRPDCIDRVRIIDYSHLAHIYANSRVEPLSTTLMVNDRPELINTTIITYTIKAINRYARQGLNPVVVCFDGRGCTLPRKAYFSSIYGIGEDNKGAGYKARRECKQADFLSQMDMTLEFLQAGGVQCLKASGYEADDLISAAVDRAKIDYPDLPIDIITGDADLLPLVDEQVSVFLRSVKTTSAENKALEITHYVQVTPRTYQGICENLTAYKNLKVPYNTVLLAKLLRGDKSDEVIGKKDWKPKRYNELIDYLVANNVSDIFRYGKPKRKAIDRRTNRVLTLEEDKMTAKEDKIVTYEDPDELVNILNVLGKFFTDEDITHVRNTYNGINLNGAFISNIEGCTRHPAFLLEKVHGYDIHNLQRAVNPLLIQLFK